MNNEPNISLYGDGSGEDFPVLKAFQQYIDAEQAKARRRLLTVSIVFVVTLIAVIAIFSMMVIKANDRTQTLNDRMVELLLKDKDRSVEEAKAAAVHELTVKTLNETLEKLQKRIEEQDRKATEAAAAAAKEIAAAKAAAEAPSAVDSVLDRRAQEQVAKIQKVVSLLKSEKQKLAAEKQKLAAEKEKLRQEELERYRREHYPEYYAKKEAAEMAQAGLDDIDDEVSYFDDDEEEPEVPEVRKPVWMSVPKPVQNKPAEVKKNVDLDDDNGAIEYFNDADSYTIPVEVKGKRAGWRVPLD